MISSITWNSILRFVWTFDQKDTSLLNKTLVLVSQISGIFQFANGQI